MYSFEGAENLADKCKTTPDHRLRPAVTMTTYATIAA